MAPPLKRLKTSDPLEVIVVLENNIECMDVKLISNVLKQFEFDVVYAGRQTEEPFVLTESISIKAQMKFSSAVKENWKLIILPGGNKAMPFLFADKDLRLLLNHHVKKNNGLLAAMGSSATQLLPRLGIIDPLGPICYPLPDTQVVIRENNIWASPGMATATELALAIGEHFLGTKEAKRVANDIGFLPGVWTVENLKEVKRPIWRSNKLKMINTGFWEVVWPMLSDLGWGSDFETSKSWIFWRSGIDDCLVNEQRIKGLDWFDSPISVLEYLSQQNDSSSIEIMLEFHRKVDDQSNKEVLPKHKEDALNELFQCVVWKRLENWGWNKHPDDTYSTPLDHSPRKEVKGRDELFQLLLTDPGFRMNPRYLYTIDLFKQCSITYQSLMFSESPTAIETITKKRIPALAAGFYEIYENYITCD
jgi:hypothetical protein